MCLRVIGVAFARDVYRIIILFTAVLHARSAFLNILPPSQDSVGHVSFKIYSLKN